MKSLDRTPNNIGWDRPPQAVNRQHRFLFFRCAVSRAADLFKLFRPISKRALLTLTRRFREWTPHPAMPEDGSERVFSVLDRLVSTNTVLRADFLGQHSAWMDRALRAGDRTLRLKEIPGLEGPEEDGEFLYMPSLKRCYTLVWRWLPLLVAGEREKHVPSLTTPECNEVLGLLRGDLALHSTTYLDLYPRWVEPREAGSLFDKDRRLVRNLDPWKYRFQPWEGVTT
jgi:hypothetical protein